MARASEATMQWLHNYYELIDARKVGEAGSLLSDDVRMIFANGEPIEGRESVQAALDGLLGSVAGLRHILHDVWEEPGGLVIFECDAIYTRKDGREVPCRGGAFFILDDNGLCTEQRITVDTSPVYAA